MSMLSLYLLTRLTVLGSVATTVTCMLSIFILFVGTATFLVIKEFEYDTKEFFKALKISIICLLVSACTALLIPNNKDLAIILTGSYITNSEEAKKLPDNVLKLINQYIDNNLDKKSEKK